MELSIIKFLIKEAKCSVQDIAVASVRQNHALIHVFEEDLVSKLIKEPSRSKSLILKYPHVQMCTQLVALSAVIHIQPANITSNVFVVSAVLRTVDLTDTLIPCGRS